MAKYIINASKYYITDNNCPLCSKIDRQFNNILSLESAVGNVYRRHLIEELDSQLVDGYGLEDLLLSLGASEEIVLSRLSDIPSSNFDYYNSVYKRLGFPYKKYNEYKALSSTASCIRFCRKCGARKHDIFNSREFLSLNEIKVASVLDKSHMLITLEHYGVLGRDGVIIPTYEDEMTCSDYEASPNSSYQLSCVNNAIPDIEKFKYNDNNYVLLMWRKDIGTDVCLYKSLKDKNEYSQINYLEQNSFSVIKDNNGCLAVFHDSVLIHKIIDDEYLSLDLNDYQCFVDIINLNTVYDYYISYHNTAEVFGRWIPSSISISADVLDEYLYSYTVNIYKAINNGENYEMVHSISVPDINNRSDEKIVTYIDNDITDNNLYKYKIVYTDEMDVHVHTVYTECLYESEVQDVPRKIDFYFRKCKELLPADGFAEKEYIYAVYEADNEQEICFKLHDVRTPSLLGYLKEDIVIYNHDKYSFDDKETNYLLKVYIRSKLYKQYASEHLGNYMDKYFYNINPQEVLTACYEPYEDNIAVDFSNNEHKQVVINIRAVPGSSIKSFYLVFGQVGNPTDFIINDDFSAYKTINIKYHKQIADYQVVINGLASNTLWVFGVFPDYEHADPDIRLEYQKILKITPWWNEHEQYSTFYDTGKWYLGNDFFKYDKDGSKIDIINEKAWMCENLKHMECPPLLIHEDKLSEHFTLEFDYKMINQSSKEAYHFQINGDTKLTVITTGDKWVHAVVDCFNIPFVILRWELMKLFDGLQACAMVRNIEIRNYFTEDVSVDNYSYTYDTQIKNKNFYNRTIQHDAAFKYSGDRYFLLEVDIDKYYQNGIYVQ